MSDLNGQTVAGYPLEKLLYTASYAEVYQAASSAAPLSVRLLREDLRADGVLGASLVKGWESARSVVHPNLVTVFSTGMDVRLGAYALEELVSGKVMRQMLLGGAKVAWRDLLVLAEQLFSAVAALHGGRQLHGEIWPGNIMLTQDQDLKLGGAGAIPQLGSWPTRVLSGTAVGYIAPELLNGSPFTQESDIYSAGAVLYFVLAGQDPYPGDDTEAVSRSVLDRKPAAVDGLRTDLPPEATAFIGRLMAKDPTQRYGSAAAVLADIALMKAGDAMAPLKGGRPAAPPKAQVVAAPKPAASPAQPPSGSGSKPKGTSSLGLKAVGTGRVFGRLETHVKSTIPQSETEKRGDDHYRQGQLPLALASWKDALNANAHAALKIKIELGEKELQKEAFSAALEDARYRLTQRDFKSALNHAQDALIVAETEAQRQDALKLKALAEVGAEEAGRTQMLKLIIGGVIFVVVLIVAFKMIGSPPPEVDEAPAIPPPPTDPNMKKGATAPKAGSGRVRILGGQATLLPPAPWTGEGMELHAVPEPGKVAATLRISAAGKVRGTEKLQEFRAKAPVPNATQYPESENFFMIDGIYPVSEIGYRYTTPENQTAYRYYYLVSSPNETLYVAQFDGPESTFNATLQSQMRTIIQSWTYRK
ncbi:MAG TPA: serine/threonine-protein kinase [Planctomycetota bacterium]|jgi:serine/threonine-protein kinase